MVNLTYVYFYRGETKCLNSFIRCDLDVSLAQVMMEIKQTFKIHLYGVTLLFAPEDLTATDVETKLEANIPLEELGRCYGTQIPLFEALGMKNANDDIPGTITVIAALLSSTLAPPLPGTLKRGPDVLEVREANVKKIRTGLPPSMVAKSISVYASNQADSTIAILDGRFTSQPTAGLPVQLYHPAFATFIAKCDDASLAIPEDVIRETARLIGILSKLASEEPEREMVVVETLCRILNIDRLVPLDGTSSNYVHRTCTGIDSDTDAVPFIADINLEWDGSFDPTVQVSLSYQRYYAPTENDAVRGMSCCPSFLLSLAGPLIIIMGAIFGTRVIVQKIAPPGWYCRQRVISDGDTEVAARPLYALRLALDELKMWYANLRRRTTDPERRTAFLRPHFTSFRNSEGATKHFFYTDTVNDEPSCAVFLAKMEEDNREVVVKFVCAYGEAGHRWMAERRLAPELLYCGQLGEGYEGRSMVVMEKVEGMSLFEVYGNSAYGAPAAIQDAVRSGLATLKEGGFIFPDLRTPNVMLVDEDGVEGDKRRVQFIDFDWVCGEGEGARYPCHLSSFVMEASGAEDGVLITREHERKMLECMFAPV